MASRPVHAIVPVKALDVAKRRLAGILTLAERQALVLAMLDDVLAAVQRAGFAGVDVLSPDRQLLTAAADRGARPLPEPPGAASLNGALEMALATLAPDVVALVLLADTPLVSPDDLYALVAAIEAIRGDGSPAIALAPDRTGTGTNALAQRPATAMPLYFGPASLARHLVEAERRGLHVQVCQRPGLALDLDTPADLAAFLSIPSTTRTRRLLDEIGVAARLAAGGRRWPCWPPTARQAERAG